MSNRKLLSENYPRRASSWQLRTRALHFNRRPALMGIVNVTPDSFSDGGKFIQKETAVEHALKLDEAGADILDIGGESTRPYADPVSEQEEMDRVLEVIEGIAKQTDTPISIDTTKSAVAAAAIELGAEIINDISGLEADPKMLAVAVQSGAGVCAMHMQGTPQTMQDNPEYKDVVSEIFDYLERRKDVLLAAGIPREKICLDPGIGFGKTHQHNLTLMAECGKFHALGYPILVGHSRKGFLAKVLGDKQADRTAATIGSALALAIQGIQIIRVHDVEPVRQALLAFEAVGGIDGQELQLAD